MTESQRIVLQILKASLSGKNIEIPADTDWEQVFDDMRAQTVSELAADWIKSRTDIPEKLKERWLKLSLAQLGIYCRIIYEQQSLNRLMSENGIPMVIIKGTAACIYYPHPEKRRMGDIDFLVPENDFDKAFQLMKDNGYACFNEHHIDNLHSAFLKNDIDFELHRRPQGIKAGKEWEQSRHIFDDALLSPIVHSLGGYEFTTFPHIQNGLILLLHIKKHLPSGLGLRQIIDWMMFVSKYLDDEHWQLFKVEAEKLGIANFAKTVTRMCQIYLGLTDDRITWCTETDEKVCSQLMDWVMTKGNFGRREDYMESKGRNTLMGNNGFFKRLKFMQAMGLQKWEAARKCIFLRPFAWVYELVRYMKYIFSRPKAIRSLFNDFITAKKQRKFIDNLMK